jgi:hypothetical protein
MRRASDFASTREARRSISMTTVGVKHRSATVEQRSVLDFALDRGRGRVDE